jgi:2-polyprenyl-3-methyl-5-hydroxy-6-metoxy-1,4-benzoquinol methylase
MILSAGSAIIRFNVSIGDTSETSETYKMVGKETPVHMPILNEGNEFEGGQRDYFKRLALIKSAVDFRNKNVLDLGCSDGFFALSLAKEAKHITAIEADSYKVARCKRMQKQLNIDNVDFHQRSISVELLEGLPHYDVIIFMAVFHHMWSASSAYGVNANSGKEEAKAVLASICRKTDTLVFEIGKTKEEDAKDSTTFMSRRRQKRWVTDELLRPEFVKVESLAGAGYYRLPWGARRLSVRALGWPIGAKIVRRLYLRRKNIDQRDILRYIYIASR